MGFLKQFVKYSNMLFLIHFFNMSHFLQNSVFVNMDTKVFNILVKGFIAQSDLRSFKVVYSRLLI